jgi:hypothetical protein
MAKSLPWSRLVKQALRQVERGHSLFPPGESITSRGVAVQQTPKMDAGLPII